MQLGDEGVGLGIGDATRGAEFLEFGVVVAEGGGALGTEEGTEREGGAGEDVEEGEGFGEGEIIGFLLGDTEYEDAHELDFVFEGGGVCYRGEAGLFGGVEGAGVEAVFEGVGVAEGSAAAGV